jgi:hypothetical protein
MAIHITLIHNLEDERLAYLRPIVRKLSVSSELILDEVYEQEISDINFHQLLIRKIRFLISQVRWYRAMNCQKRLWLISMIANLSEFCKIAISRDESSRQKRRAQAENALSRKHLLSIEKFLDIAHSRDVLLVLESDAIFSSEYFSKCIEFASRNQTLSPLWLMTSPFSFEQLFLDKSKLNRKKASGLELGVFPALYVNTTASYMMSFELAKAVLSESKKSTESFLASPDYMLNSIFLRLRNDFIKRETALFKQSPVENGSLKGYYGTTI